MDWNNPYKFRLWLGTLDHDLLNDRQKRELIFFTSWGPRGCDSWNYRLALEFHCSRRTVQLDLRHLEKHSLIDIRGALGKHRRIIAIPYPNRAMWMATSIRQISQKLGEFWANTGPNRGAKFCAHQRRTKELSINQQFDELLYGKSFLLFSGGGSSETCATQLSPDEARTWEQTRHKMIDQLVRTGHPRDSAITLANITIEKSIQQKGKNVENPEEKTTPAQDTGTDQPVSDSKINR